MALLVIASALYRLMARRMRGYDDAQARQIFRDLIDMPADVAHLGIHGRRPWRRLSGVLRARRLPVVEAGISSIRKRHSGCVTWRPVLKQVLPCRSLNSAAEIDPELPPTAHRSTSESEVPEGTTLRSERLRGAPDMFMTSSIRR
jgi:hypothetical protein